MDLLLSLIKNVGDPFPAIYTAQMYPTLMTLLSVSDDSGVLQNGQYVLCTLVHRDFAGIVNVKSGNTTGLDLLLQFIAKMLSPDSAESSAMFVGKLVRKLISKGGDHIMPIIPQLLVCVAHRLENAKMPTFIETLVLIFCSLIETQCQTVIEFLYGTQLTNSNALDLVFKCWCDSFGDFQGFYEVKLTTKALILVLETNDPRLMQISVKGDEIVNNHQKSILSS